MSIVKTRNAMPFQGNNSTDKKDDSSKLVSVLALAASAAAMPQTSNADIIFQGANVNVGFGVDLDYYALNLFPSSTVFAFGTSAATYHVGLYTTQYRSVVGGAVGGAAGAIRGNGNVAAAGNFGQAWSAVGATEAGLLLAGRSTRTMFYGASTNTFHVPITGYDHKYYAFRFNGATTRYGWIEVGLFFGSGTGGPRLHIYGYAYDDTGAKPSMGQMPVPEPTSAALLTLGALAFGSKGLRSWRRKRTAACKS